MNKVENAIIKSTDLTIADHGLLSGWLHLEYDCGGQGFGGMSLYLPPDFKHHAGQSNFAGLWIFRVMQIAGVEHWKDLPGKAIRVEHGGAGSTIKRIGHIVKNDWFDPEQEFKNLKG